MRIVMQELLTSFLLCRNESRDENALGKVWKAQRGSKGSLAFFQRVPQGLDAMQSRLWTSTGSLQGVSTGSAEVLQEVQNFYRKFCYSYRKL